MKKYIILIIIVVAIFSVVNPKALPILGIIIGAILLYFLPSVVANKRKRSNASAITILNLLLGWTIVGWVIALVWAVSEDK